jgi:serine/threonine protein kinase
MDLPEQFGRYRIVKKLGAGGMGTVYLAEDTALGRTVALKIPSFSPGDAETERQRFRREARAAALLEHPNICSVYDIGVIDDQPYLTMAYIEGQPLGAFVSPDKPMAQGPAADLVRRLAMALETAHVRGVIHRDLKPSNVMIKAGGEPVVTDFGLARLASSEDSHLTGTGSVMGTPAYMAPEQARGDLKQIGPATDIYSLGVILYELLTGRVPFQGSSALVCALVLTSDPPTPSSFRPDLDPRLEAICLRAMAKTPADRYSSMHEFGAALSGFLRETAASRSVRDPAPTVVNVNAAIAATERTNTDPTAVLKPPVRRGWGYLLAALLIGLTMIPLAVSVGIYLSQTPTAETHPVIGDSSPLSTSTSVPLASSRGSSAVAPADTRKPATMRDVPLPRDVVNSLGMKLVLIRAGRFLMGSPTSDSTHLADEELHEAVIDHPYYLGVYEVTQEEWSKVMGSNPSHFAFDRVGQNTARFPVESVSYEDALKFCHNLSEMADEKSAGRVYRLPTEAEWEYACRGGTRDNSYFYFKHPTMSMTSTQSNCDGTHPYGDAAKGPFLQRITKVGSYEPNAFGLYDMHGNVREWCQDFYAPYLQRPRPGYAGPLKGKTNVLRGGCWYDYPILCRAARRIHEAPETRDSYSGLRVCFTGR